MAADFNIYEYIEGLSGFVFDKTVIKRIATEREVTEIASYSELTEKQRDLLLADVLFTAYRSPNMMASHTNQHGAYSKTFGHQIVNREALYGIFSRIYKKYGEEEKLVSLGGVVRWVDES